MVVLQCSASSVTSTLRSKLCCFSPTERSWLGLPNHASQWHRNPEFGSHIRLLKYLQARRSGLVTRLCHPCSWWMRGKLRDQPLVARRNGYYHLGSVVWPRFGQPLLDNYSTVACAAQTRSVICAFKFIPGSDFP